MPFVTKNPSYYFAALSDESATESLHIGLFLGGTISNEKRQDLITLARLIRQSSRSIRCLWLRFKDGDESLLSAFRAFGEELAAVDTAAATGAEKGAGIQSLVFEGRVNTDVISCLSDFLFIENNNDLRGIQFRRTDVDITTFTLLRPFFTQSNDTLKVIDMSSNPNVGDECIDELLGALLDGETKIETLNITENNLDGEDDDSRRISGDCVASIASYVSQTPSVTSITLRLRHLDDIGIGEIANVIKDPECKLRRLDVSGNFGNSGINIFAEALKTNTSLRTITFGCLKTLNDAGGQVLLDVVNPFPSKFNDTEEDMGDVDVSSSEEWDKIKRSNHTLQSIYILDRPTVTVNKALLAKLESISSLDPHRTLQSKCWQHLEKNIEDISHLDLETKHMPEVLSFVQQNGSMDHLYLMIKSNGPELFSYPSPEKKRMLIEVERAESENSVLKEQLKEQRIKTGDLQRENHYLRNLFRKEEAKTCCLLSYSKICEMWKMFIELLTEPIMPVSSPLG